MVETPKPKGNGKGIDAGLWRQVRIRALQEDKASADVMNDALRAYFRDDQDSPTATPAPEPQAEQTAPRTAPSAPKPSTTP